MAFILNMNVWSIHYSLLQLVASTLMGSLDRPVFFTSHAYFPISGNNQAQTTFLYSESGNLRIKTLLKTNAKSLPKKEQQKNNS